MLYGIRNVEKGVQEMRISAVADFRNPQPSGYGFFVAQNSVEYKHDI